MQPIFYDDYLVLGWPSVVEKLQDFVFVFAIFVARVLVQVVAVLVVAAAVVEFEVVAEEKFEIEKIATVAVF